MATPTISAHLSAHAKQRTHVARVLDETDWNMSRSARILGIDRGTLYAKVKRFGLERPGDGA